MKTLTLTIPDVLVDELNSASHDYLLELLERGLREVKIDRALELYSRGGMSFGAAAERAGVPVSDLARSAYARGGLQAPFSSETLREESARLKELLLADTPRAEVLVTRRRRRTPAPDTSSPLRCGRNVSLSWFWASRTDVRDSPKNY